MRRLPEVTRLDMSHNSMTYLGEESVSMAKLTHLYLDHMSLRDLSDQARAPLLSHLDLSHNQLRYLEPLTGPKELAALDLTGTADVCASRRCRQEHISSALHDNRHSCFLKGNPVDCNCYMRPLRQWTGVGGVKLLGSCAGPPHLSGEPLQDVAPADLRCRSRAETLKGELEKADESPGSLLPADKPKQKATCPVNCDCDVSV